MFDNQEKNIRICLFDIPKKKPIKKSKEEIEEIIKKFSETAKIPVHEGVFKVVVGKLIFSAVISNIIGSKFIIRKMVYNPGLK